MIDDLSRTLDALLNDPSLQARFPELRAARIDFARPPNDFVPGLPIVNLFLYDIRENLELRNNEPIVTRNGTQATIRKPSRRIDCSYLVTAWTNVTGELGAYDEHQLLGQTLEVLGGYPTIPPAFLVGRLQQNQEPPLPLLAPHVDGLKSAAEFWTAMGNQLRASFTVTVTLSMPQFADVTAGTVSTARTGVDVGAGVDETLFGIGGEVRANAAGGGGPIAAAFVNVVDAGLRATTDADGRYRFECIPAGNRTFQVVAVGFQPAQQVVTVPGQPPDYDFQLAPI